MTDRIRNAFDSIHAEEELKERTRRFLENQTKSRRTKSRAFYGRLAAAMACVVVMVGVGGWVYVTPVSAISLDINPSIELGINRFDRVVSVETYNDDNLLPATILAVKNMNYADAIEEILSNETIAQLLNENERMEVTVVNSDEKQRSQMLTRVESCTAGAENISCHAGDSHEADEAHHMGMSVGKYRVLQELRALDPDVLSEDVQNLTMRELRERINALSGGSLSDPGCDDVDHQPDCDKPDCDDVSHQQDCDDGNWGGNGNGVGNGTGTRAGNGNSTSTGTGHGHGHNSDHENRHNGW